MYIKIRNALIITRFSNIWNRK